MVSLLLFFSKRIVTDCSAFLLDPLSWHDVVVLGKNSVCRLGPGMPIFTGRFSLNYYFPIHVFAVFRFKHIVHNLNFILKRHEQNKKGEKNVLNPALLLS